MKATHCFACYFVLASFALSLLLVPAANTSAQPEVKTPKPGEREYRRYGYDRPAIRSLERSQAADAARANKPTEPYVQPNIVFFFVDDQRMDRVNYLPEGQDENGNGVNLTPNMDRLSSQGVILDAMHVPSPVCIPSRYSLLTGQYGSRAQSYEIQRRFALHGFPPTGQNTKILPGQTVTLAQHLQNAGYTTGIVGKNHVVEVKGWKRSKTNENIDNPKVKQRLIDNQDRLREAFQASGFDYAERLYHDNLHGNTPKALVAHNLDWITQGALEFIDQNKDRPFFLYFASTMPHGPINPASTWRADRRITPVGMLDEPVKLLTPAWEIKKKIERAGIKDLQRGNAMWIDSALGVLMQKLEDAGVADNTIVIFMSDHGVKSGKASVYQGGMVTHAFLHGPDRLIQGQRRVDALLSSVDFAPTILSWAGADPAQYADEFDGVSFAPVMAGQLERTRASVYGEIGYSRAVRLGDWKYIALRPSPYLENLSLEEKTANLDRWFARRDRTGLRREANHPTDPYPHIMDIPGGVDNTWSAIRKHPWYYQRDQLYNLAEDPDEQVNLAYDPAYAPVLETLRLEMSRYLERLPGQFGEFPGDTNVEPIVPLD
ncbi:MAG: sulfatase-like hydrolase/transferase [Planctomycetota bacterium]